MGSARRGRDSRGAAHTAAAWRGPGARARLVGAAHVPRGAVGRWLGSAAQRGTAVRLPACNVPAPPARPRHPWGRPCRPYAPSSPPLGTLGTLRTLRTLCTLCTLSTLCTLCILCRWRSHGGVLRTATLSYLTLLQRVGCSAARRVLCAWRAAADSRCVHRAHAPRAAAHRRQSRLACALGCWVARTAAAAMARCHLARGARGAMLRVVASWRARAAARRASRKIMAEVEPLAKALVRAHGYGAMAVVTAGLELTS